MKKLLTLTLMIHCLIVAGQIDITNINQRRDYALSGLNAFEVKCVDLDGDGKPDMVVSNPTAGSIAIFQNQSSSGIIDSASLTNRQDILLGGSPNYFHIADFDMDGKPDIAISATVNNSVTILKNASILGTISFSIAKVINLNEMSGGISGGYINNDSLTDLVVSSYGSTYFYVLKNSSSSSGIDFDTLMFISPNSRLTQVLMHDFNGDAKPDLVFCRDVGFNLLVYKNNTGSEVNSPIQFDYQTVLTSGSTPNRGDAADIDGDSKIDLVVSNYNSSASYIHRNVSTADSILFHTGVSFETDGKEYIQSSRLQDLNNDGKPDLIQTFGIDPNASTMQVYMNQAVLGDFNATTFGAPVRIPTLARPVGITFSDIDGDGATEIIVCNFDSDKISVFGRENKIVGLNLIADKPPVILYPNPTTGLLKIENKETIQSYITLNDITGRQIRYLSVLPNSTTQLDMIQLPSGVYFLIVNSQAGNYCYKVMLNK